MNHLLLLPLPLALLLAAPAAADTVISVGDGDTLTVTGAQGRRTIRLACIDAPEMAQRPYGQSARAALQQLAPVGSTITVKAGDTDRYGRTVAELYRGTTKLNLALVQQGQAFVYRQYLKAPCSPSAYLSAEQQAQQQKRGVWSVPGGITRPWDFRRGGRRSASAGSGSGSGASGSGASGSGRYTCKAIGSWDKAQQLLKQGHTYLDRDGDGEACESLR